MAAQLYLALGIAAASFAAGGGIAWKYQGARLETCTTVRDGLSERIREQNKGIAAQAKAAQDVAKAAQEAHEAARLASEAQQGEIDALQARISKPKATTCAAALAEIREELGK